MPQKLREKLFGHDLNQDGDHYPDDCYECALQCQVENICRCAACCRHLLVECFEEDLEREPRIREMANTIIADGIEGAAYVLNDLAGDLACIFLDRETNLCRIHETRPLICRQFDCDGVDHDELVQLGILAPREKSPTSKASDGAGHGNVYT